MSHNDQNIPLPFFLQNLCLLFITQVLVKKSYGDKQKRQKQRNWQLQMMDREFDVSMATANQELMEADYREFLEELEEDKMYRKNINIYFSGLLIPLVSSTIVMHIFWLKREINTRLWKCPYDE